MRAAGRGGEEGERAGTLPVVGVGEERRRALADQLAGPRADHFLQIPVAALDDAVPDEGDADRGVVEDQLLLGQSPFDPLLGLVLPRDVLEQPNRALRGIAGLHRAARDRAPDEAAVLAHMLAAQLQRLALPEGRVHRVAACVVLVVAREHEARGLVDELARLVAEELLEASVAAHYAAISHEDDAGERVLEHRVLLAQQAMQRLVGALALGDVLEQPDVALGAVARLHRPAADAAPEARAVLAAHPGLARVRAALVELVVVARHLLVFGVGEVDVARQRADRRAGRIAEHLLEAAVAAHRLARARELDADDDVVEERLLLGEHALQLVGCFAFFGDVLDDPHRALVRLLRVDRPAVGAVPESAAVLAPAQLDPARGLAAREHVVHRAALLEVRAARVQDRGRLAVHLARTVAVHLLVAPVAAHDAPLLDEHDADRRGAEDRLLLAQQARHLVGLAAPLGDVLDDPHRALLRILGVDRLGDQAAEEARAVLAAHFPLEVELAAGRQDRHRDLAERRVALAARVHHFARLADQLLGAIAEHLGKFRIA